MLLDKVLITAICNDYEVLRWDNFGKSFVGMTNERASCIEHIQELLGVALTAHRPEARAYAARHYHTVTITIHSAM